MDDHRNSQERKNKFSVTSAGRDPVHSEDSNDFETFEFVARTPSLLDQNLILLSDRDGVGLEYSKNQMLHKQSLLEKSHLLSDDNFKINADLNEKTVDKIVVAEFPKRFEVAPSEIKPTVEHIPKFVEIFSSKHDEEEITHNLQSEEKSATTSFMVSMLDKEENIKTDTTECHTKKMTVVEAAKLPKKSPVTKYILKRTIGQGNFSKVKLARHAATNKYVAIKIIERKKLNEDLKKKLSKEIEILKSMRHPNIVKLFEIIERKEWVYIVMEYASGGELFDFIILHGCMRERDAKKKFHDITSAVQYFHHKNIVHRDLKAENILLNRKMEIRLADFGFATHFNADTKLKTFCGSPPYAAPELLYGRKYIGPLVDVWSLGVILFILVSGRLPFDGSSLTELKENISHLRYEMPYFISNECQNLIKNIFVLKPEERITLDQIISHKWFVDKNLTKQKLFEDPVDQHVVLNDYKVKELMKQGYTKENIEESLTKRKFDDIYATYHLMDTPEVARARLLEEKFYTMETDEQTSITPSSNHMNEIILEAQKLNLEKELQTPHTISGSIGPAVGKTLKKLWACNFKKDSDNTLPIENTNIDSYMDSINPAFMDPEFQKQLTALMPTDPNLSMSKNPDQQMLMNTLNQISCSKMNKAGMFQHQNMGQKPVVKQAPEKVSSQAVLLKPAQMTKKTGIASDTSRSDASVVEVKPRPKKVNNKDHVPLATVDEQEVSESKSRKGKNRIKKLFSSKGSKKKKSSGQSLIETLTFNDDINDTTGNRVKPRTARFAVSYSTVSSKPADEIMDEIIRSLTKFKVKYEFHEKYLVVCTDGNIEWEFEVCRVGIKSLHGIRMNRIFGNSFSYGRKMNRFIQEWNL